MKKFMSGFIEHMCPEIHESAVKSMLASSCVLEAACLWSQISSLREDPLK